MKVKCENVVRCSNTNCAHNDGGYVCRHIVVAIGSNGQCALCKPKDRPAQDKSNRPQDIETSK